MATCDSWGGRDRRSWRCDTPPVWSIVVDYERRRGLEMKLCNAHALRFLTEVESVEAAGIFPWGRTVRFDAVRLS